MTRTRTKVSMQYIGGFFDGEGYVSFTFQKQGDNRPAKAGLGMVQCGSKGREVLEQIADRICSHLPGLRRPPIYERGDPDFKTYTLLWQGRGDVVRVAKLLMKYTVLKHSDLRHIIEEVETYNTLRKDHGTKEIQELIRREHLPEQVRSGTRRHMGRAFGKGGRGRMWEQMGDSASHDVSA